MRIARVEGISLSAPIDRPVESSVGRMTSRPALLVRLTADDGTEGLGEIWVNFPPWSLRERIVTLRDGIAPLVVSEEFETPLDLWRKLRSPLERLGRQCGNTGVLYQTLSGIEIALWDLMGKALGLPVCELARKVCGTGRDDSRATGEESHETEGESRGADCEPQAAGLAARIYASGLGPHDPEKLFEPLAHQGVTHAKLKLGFGREIDRRNLKSMRSALGEQGVLCVDVNQGWSVEEFRDWLPVLEEYRVAWVEEPIQADDISGMAELRAASRIAIAAGENVFGPQAWRRLLEPPAVDVVQPDVCKAGGISEALAAAELAARQGLTVVPHYLGGAVGLVATLHFARAFGRCPLVEYDANPNPLREELIEPRPVIREGCLSIEAGPGLGVRLSESALRHHAFRA